MKLVLTGPDGQGKEIEVDGVPISIGRAPDNDIVIPDRNISRYHVRLYTDINGRLMLEDVGSRYGTLLNGTKITTCEFKVGDVLTIGDWRGELVSSFSQESLEQEFEFSDTDEYDSDTPVVTRKVKYTPAKKKEHDKRATALLVWLILLLGVVAILVLVASFFYDW